MMDTPAHQHRLFFSELPAYVLTFRDKADEQRIATERTASGRAILCYLSLCAE